MALVKDKYVAFIRNNSDVYMSTHTANTICRVTGVTHPVSRNA